MKLDHAPTPWTKGNYDEWRDAADKRIVAYGVNISSVLSSPSDQERETAEFMLRAVNSHESMLSVLRTLRKAWEEIPEGFPVPEGLNVSEIWDDVYAAIDKAEGLI